MSVRLCRHCKQTKSNRPRGLCWSCYYAPGVRDLYPSTSKFAARGTDLQGQKVRLPARPTRAPPGTRAKVRVLARRVAKGEGLWHPLDARY